MTRFVVRPQEIEIYPRLNLITKLVQILPREVICNNTNRTLRIKQVNIKLNIEDEMIIKPKERKVMTWVSKEDSYKVIIEFIDHPKERLRPSPPITVTKIDWKEFF